jgi:hypothetical protein
VHHHVIGGVLCLQEQGSLESCVCSRSSLGSCVCIRNRVGDLCVR